MGVPQRGHAAGVPVARKERLMQWMADNILYVLVIGTVIIVALVALLLFMRNKGED